MPQKLRGLRRRAFVLAALLLGSSAAVKAAPFAYVPNDGLPGSGPSTVSVIDTATNTVVATIPVSIRPRTVSVSPTQVFITNQGDLAPADTGSVSVIHAATNTVTASIPVPGAFGIAWSGTRLYVAGSNDNISVVSLTTNTVISTIHIPGGIPSAGVGAEPIGVVASPSGARVYVANFIDQSVSVIDTASLSIVATVSLGAQPQAIAIDPSGSRVYTANLNSVSVIDTATNALITNIPASGANGLDWPQGLAVNPAGTSLYVTNSIGSTVSVFSTATLNPTAIIATGGSPQGISFTPDGSRVYVADKNQDLVHAISTASNTVIASIPVGITPISIGNFIVPAPPVKNGMTWAKIGHDIFRNVDRVNCTAGAVSCNPYTGDTSCSNSRPVLCVRPQGLPRPPYTPNPSLFYDGWVGGNLALTASVVGTTLTSQAVADNLCAATYGAGWRMAEFHDGGGGWGFRGYGNMSSASRFWVRISDQPANCW